MVFSTCNSYGSFRMSILDNENLKLGSDDDMNLLNNELINENYMKYKWSMR